MEVGCEKDKDALSVFRCLYLKSEGKLRISFFSSLTCTNMNGLSL